MSHHTTQEYPSSGKVYQGMPILRNLFVIEGNIGSGKSSVCSEIERRGLSVCEQQQVEKWTLLKDFYFGKREEFAYNVQKQIGDTYWDAYRAHNFEKCSTDFINGASPVSSYIKRRLESDDHKSMVTYSLPPSTNWLRADCDSPVSGGSNDTRAIFFEGILSSNGVFAPLSLQNNELSEEQLDDLNAHYDMFALGVRPMCIFYLCQESVQVCYERIRKRGRQMECSITEEYLDGISKNYEKYLSSVSPYCPVVRVDNTNIGVAETVALIEKIAMAFVEAGSNHVAK